MTTGFKDFLIQEYKKKKEDKKEDESLECQTDDNEKELSKEEKKECKSKNALIKYLNYAANANN